MTKIVKTEKGTELIENRERSKIENRSLNMNRSDLLTFLKLSRIENV